jgi:hypothetical protein
MALIAGGGALIGGLPDIIPSKYERDQKKRLADMKRQQELGALGLTDAEQANFANQFQSLHGQAQARGDAMRQAAAGIQGQPGQAALQGQLANQASMQAAAQQAQQVASTDLLRQREQEQEILDLGAAQAEYKRQRAEALVAPFSAGAEAAVKGGTIDMLAGQAPIPGLPQSQGQTSQDIKAGVAFKQIQEEFGFTKPQFDDWWSTLDANQQAYWGRI